MTSPLHDSIKAFSDAYLIEQYYRHLDQYMDEAKKIMEEEIARRGITKEAIDASLAQGGDAEAPEVVHYDKKEFTRLAGAFTTNDSLLVRSMLAEHKIPFFVDASSSLLPFNGEELDTHTVAFHVHNDSLEAARTAIGEHFDLGGGRYALKYADTNARLKSFNFYEIPHALLESREIVEVDFSNAEKEFLSDLGKRLLNEADEIEARQQRVVFYFDAMEDLIERLSGSETPSFTHTDLLAMLELLQIYCDDPAFQPIGAGLAEALMGFFSNPQGA